jgi:uncharacterized repeat protein (TIGR03803 family)
MSLRKFPLFSFRIVGFLFTVVLFAGSRLSATTETPIYAFLGIPDGMYPSGGLVADSAGNLYGMTVQGGTVCQCGTVFQLSPPTATGGSWTETILYSFGAAGDGIGPVGTLLIDAAGDLYGTTSYGGNGAGIVFELSPPASAGGAWTEFVLWNLPGDKSKGSNPQSKLAMDAEGDIFGTAPLGGAHGAGDVFELLNPQITGLVWTPKVLYNFGHAAGDGLYPGDEIVFHNDTIYGTTGVGGGGGNGTVFQLVRNSNFTWTESILHSFAATEGINPWGGLVMDSEGNLFGAASHGGTLSLCEQGCGTIYELSPVSGGQWQFTALYSFQSKGDGAYPFARLWRDKLGDLFGTAYSGGMKSSTCVINTNRCGTVFKLKAPTTSGGAWTLQVLHDFGGYSAGGDGGNPGTDADLIFVSGLLYGITGAGGNQFNLGTVFSVVP